MATQRKRRRGTAAQHASFTGAEAEITMVTDTNRIRLHDAAKVGGFEFLNAADIQNQAGTAALAAGTADALTLTLTPAVAAYAAYQKFTFEAASNNTAAATLNVNGLGAKTVKKNAGADDLAADDLVAGGVYDVVYDGVNFQISGGIGGSGGHVFIGSVTLTTDATADFTALDFATYASYILKINVHVSADMDLWCQFFQSATIIEAGTDYGWRYDGLLAALSNGDAKMIIAKSIYKGASLYNEGVTGILQVFPRVTNGSAWQGSSVIGHFQHHTITSGNAVQSISSGGLHKNINQIDGIRIKASTGTMVAGLIELWGVKKS